MRTALQTLWKSKLVWFIHIAGNAAILAAIYGWLSIPDRTITHLILSAIAGIGIVMFAAWLHGSTFVYFRIYHETGTRDVRRIFRPSIRRILFFALFLLFLASAILIVLQLQQYQQNASNWTASALTLRLRRPVQPEFVSSVLSVAIAAIAWIVIPILLLPFGSAVASGTELRRSWRTIRSRRYWLSYIALFIAGAYIPYRLVWWVPAVNGMYAQAASMASRFSIAYFLAVTSWVALASELGRPRN